MTLEERSICPPMPIAVEGASQFGPPDIPGNTRIDVSTSQEVSKRPKASELPEVQERSYQSYSVAGLLCFALFSCVLGIGGSCFSLESSCGKGGPKTIPKHCSMLGPYSMNNAPAKKMWHNNRFSVFPVFFTSEVFSQDSSCEKEGPTPPLTSSIVDPV